MEAFSCLEGNLADISLPELLRFLPLQKADGTLHLASENERGRVYFRQGQLRHVERGALSGPEALYPMLKWLDATFEFKCEAYDGRQSIFTNPETLILQGFRNTKDWKIHQRFFPTSDQEAIFTRHSSRPSAKTSAGEERLLALLNAPQRFTSLKSLTHLEGFELLALLTPLLASGLVTVVRTPRKVPEKTRTQVRQVHAPEVFDHLLEHLERKDFPQGEAVVAAGL